MLNTLVPVPLATDKVPSISALSASVREPVAPIWTLLNALPALVRFVEPLNIQVEEVVVNVSRLVRFTLDAGRLRL